MGQRDERLGVVTDGSFTAGLTVRLDGHLSEDLQVGSFVVLEGERSLYFSLVSDLQLRTTDPGVSADPPVENDLLRAALQGIHTYTAAVVRPSLMLENKDDLVEGGRPHAVRTIPSHFAVMKRARAEHFDLVFGREAGTVFAIGKPIAMDDVDVTIDLAKLVERPSGIFGQTGTGKSVLTRLVLYGVIREDVASALVFDMHSEYADTPQGKPDIPGLRDLFGSTNVKVYSLDAKDTRAASHIVIGMNQIEPEDIELLSDELGIRDTFAATSYALTKQFGSHWLQRLLELEGEELKEFVARTGAHEGAVAGLRRKLQFFERRPYIQRQRSEDPVRDIVHLLKQGKHVIVQFGRYHDLVDYMLVTNLLTRRIHAEYTDQAQQGEAGGLASEIRPVVVVLEEAHKFLSPEVSRQSIFGTIAREMRKFGVTLMVVDQRPSKIDDEVMSQLATRISGLLTDESDIAAVLSGTSDRNALRGMLASLEPTQQILVLGHAIPMPMVVRTRDYSPRLKDEAARKPSVASEADIDFLVAQRS